MELLTLLLSAVGLLWLVPLWFSLLNNGALRRGACSKYHSSDRETLLAIWSLITSTISYICLLKLEDRFMYWFLSFIFALSLTTTEYLTYGRKGIRDLSDSSFFTGILAAWLFMLGLRR